MADIEICKKFMKDGKGIKKKGKELASQRVVVENVIGLLKRFKIIADKY